MRYYYYIIIVLVILCELQRYGSLPPALMAVRAVITFRYVWCNILMPDKFIKANNEKGQKILLKPRQEKYAIRNGLKMMIINLMTPNNQTKNLLLAFLLKITKQY